MKSDKKEKKLITKPVVVTQEFSPTPPISVRGIMPLLIFVILFVVVGIILDIFKTSIVSISSPMGFYLVYAPIIALIAVIAGFFIIKANFKTKLNAFLKGSAEQNILIMVFIYLLSGVFAKLMIVIGASSAVAFLGFKIIAPTVLVGGVFIISAIIATAMGTSVGTIVAFGPIVFPMANQGGVSSAMVAGALLCGAMLGDNLSLISDTAIAACRTQDVKAKSRFLYNLKILLFPCSITIILFFTITYIKGTYIDSDEWIWWKAVVTVIPFILILVTALIGANVFFVLLIGIISALIVGFSLQQFGNWNKNNELTTSFLPNLQPYKFKVDNNYYVDTGIDQFLVSMNAIKAGMISMTEVILLALITGGLTGLSELSGGITWVTQKINRKIKGKRSAEVGIFSLASIADLALANNTIAIIVTGPIIKKIGEHHQLSKNKVAVLLTIATTIFQGLIPYGAQMLILTTTANNYANTINQQINFVDVWKYSWYLYLLLLVTIIFVISKPLDKLLGSRFNRESLYPFRIKTK